MMQTFNCMVKATTVQVQCSTVQQNIFNNNPIENDRCYQEMLSFNGLYYWPDESEYRHYITGGKNIKRILHSYNVCVSVIFRFIQVNLKHRLCI